MKERKGCSCILGWFYFQEADLIIHLAKEAAFITHHHVCHSTCAVPPLMSQRYLLHPREEQRARDALPRSTASVTDILGTGVVSDAL